MIYERGNAAKQWILTELVRRFPSGDTRVLDLGCGDGQKWKKFLTEQPSFSVVGLDTDARAIARGQASYANEKNIRLEVFDAQKKFSLQDFDAVVAFSAIEHVVDRSAFLLTVWQTLKNGGVAFLNYDEGHFRSRNLKERIMVPVSQLLALVGIEGPYMKRVDEELFKRQALAQGFQIECVRKHNLESLKGLMRGAPEETIEAWYEFEERLGTLTLTERLQRAFYSTTLVLHKP